MKVVGVIPSRYDSVRFPGKPLASILGKCMIQWVYERVKDSGLFEAVYVATDDGRIYDTVIGFGGNAIMTGVCKSGTDRVYEATKDMDFDIVVNIQGDEPAVSPDMLKSLLGAFEDETVCMATLKKKIEDSKIADNPNVVKVLCNRNNDAVYFSRSVIPYGRECDPMLFKHIGIYAFKKDFLKTFINLGTSVLEDIEKLEQLRAIDYGYKIRVVETEFDSAGVDNPEDISKVETILLKEMEG